MYFFFKYFVLCLKHLCIYKKRCNLRTVYHNYNVSQVIVEGLLSPSSKGILPWGV